MPFFKSRGPSKGRGSGAGGSQRSGGGGGRPGGRSGGGRPGGKPGGRPGGKPYGKKKAGKKRRAVKKKAVKKATVPNIENTGMEGLYFRDLMDAEQEVMLKLTNGEEVRGYVRYYDKDVISIGPSDDSPKMFIRKDGIRYMYEIDDE